MSSEPVSEPTDLDRAAILGSVSVAWRDGRFTEGLELIRTLPPELREEFPFMAYEAELHGRLGDHERELQLLAQLIARQPETASLWVSKAYALMMLGRRDESVEAYRRAIDLQPTYGKAWWGLSELRSHRFDDSDVAAMTAAIANATRAEDVLHLHFALGKAFEDRDDAAEAFEHYKRANALRASSIPPTAMRVSTRVDRVIETFTGSFFESRRGRGCDSEAPIFIVGLQRSGSTLVEQILASHPQVEGVGELPLIPHLTNEIATSQPDRGLFKSIAALDAASRASLGEAYLSRAQAFRHSQRPRFIDKLPTNWLHVGVIRLILPNAKIIDARRHPMATGFSNFKQNYGTGVDWSYSLATIGRYYRDYLRLMAHFERVQPGAVHRLINERLVEDFEAEVRALLDYLGLPFEPACLEFHRTDRAVRTPSAEQVRRPISRAGLDQWRPFEPWLDELKTALGPALEGWDAPPGEYVDDGR